MSAAASWSYTAKATIWPANGRANDWNGGRAFGLPVVIACDYGATSKTVRTARGDEFAAKLAIYTEHAGARVGDMVAIGEHTSSQPVADAREVMVIERQADTFDRRADDYTLLTG
ncbi:MAG: hypothetical protein RIS88_2788 [Pseudomonadota bacterium]|jgi:hypothetical protein